MNFLKKIKIVNILLVLGCNIILSKIEYFIVNIKKNIPKFSCGSFGNSPLFYVAVSIKKMKEKKYTTQ